MLSARENTEDTEPKKIEPHALPTRFFGAYRTYCEADYQELYRLHKDPENLQKRELDENAILSLY